METGKFSEIVTEYYRLHARELPWREEPYDSYRILVSEMMLQQTQASRVIPKYQSFLEKFPDVKALAEATLGDVLREWSGLGYNRRAKYLYEAARQLADKPQPWSCEDLERCKGIGRNTAAAVVVYAYNQPLVFIETNVRTVFIHHFFSDSDTVHDKEILPLIEATLDREQPRDFYYALMDYGTYIKKTIGNTARRSQQYNKQSVFQGSLRQVRGAVMRQLVKGSCTATELENAIPDDRLPVVLERLVVDGLVQISNDTYQL